MWNKLKGFLGFLNLAGCLIIWLSFIPIDPLRIYSETLGHYGWLLVGFSFLAFSIVLVLHGINEYFYRFKPEPRRRIWRSKRVTRAIATVFILTVLITGLGWWFGRPYLLALGALSPEEVAIHPERYQGEKISVVGYYYPDYWGALRALGINADGFICSVKGSESFESFAELWKLISGGSYLFVKLPPDTRVHSEEKCVFTGVIEMENSPSSEPPLILVASSVVSIDGFAQ